MKAVLIGLLICISVGVQAEVFKCIGKSGRTVYQEKPCESAVKAQQLDIKADPAKEAEAKSRLEAIRLENDARKAERLKAEKEAAEQRNQAEQTNALKRSAWAQQQQAIAEQRQAEALERQNQQPVSPFWVLPGFSGLPHKSGERFDHDFGRPGRRHDQHDDQAKRAPIVGTPPSPPVPGRQ